MSVLRLYDTFAREKRVFTPRELDRITMYLCGPTVYGRAHIGNARPAVVFDVLAGLLKHLYPDHRLDYARNITDVDDKIIAAAQAEGIDPQIITDRYERHYLEDTAALGVEAPPIQPRATAHVPDMIAMIARLVELGHAYAAQGHVLFSVASDPDYGSLSRRDAEALRAGARVEVAPYKRDAGDFVLWKPSAPEVIGWDSPWGRGRPGWHIECSAMIERHLGTTIDIHAGGLDLIFPHHENEAAQSRCAHGGEPLANIWMHNGFVNMGGGDKMSKSVGNVVLINDLLAAGHKGEVLRFALLSAHYSKPLDWTDEALTRSKATLDRWYGLLALRTPVEHEIVSVQVVDALSDDLNTPAALSSLSELCNEGFAFNAARFDLVEDDELRHIHNMTSATTQMIATLQGSARVLRLLQMSAQQWFKGEGLPTVEIAITARNDAKSRRNFAEADRIRSELAAEGILLEDTPTGTTWRRA